MYRVVRLALLPACGLWLAACAASDFKQPVSDFGKATNNAADAFDTYNASLSKALADRRTTAALGSFRARPANKQDDCRSGAHRCTLIFQTTTGSTVDLASLQINSIVAAMSALKDYTSGLNDIVNADTQAAIDKGVNDVKTNVLALAKTGDAFAKATTNQATSIESRVTPFAAPIASAVSLGLGHILEEEKIAALRNATDEMEARLPSVILLLNAAVETAYTSQVNAMDKKFNAALDDFNRGPKTAARFDALNSATAEYDALLHTDPTAMFTALGKAHTALRDALQNPQVNTATVFMAVQRVTDEAVKLATIAKQLKDATKNKKT